MLAIKKSLETLTGFKTFFVAPMDVMIAVESDGNSADKIAQLINDFENFGNQGLGDEPDFAVDSAHIDTEEDPYSEYVPLDEDDSADGYDYSYNLGYDSSSSMSIEKTADGYCCGNGNGTKFWFGNKNGALFFTTNESLIPSALKKADKPVPSELVSFATSRKFMYFFNLGKVKDFSSAMDKDVKKAFNAFDEVLSNLETLTGFKTFFVALCIKKSCIMHCALCIKKVGPLTSSSCHPKVFVKEFCYFLMSCHQHCLGVNLLVQR